MRIGIDLTFFNKEYAGKEINAMNIVLNLISLVKEKNNDEIYIFYNNNINFVEDKNIHLIKIPKKQYFSIIFRSFFINKLIKQLKIDKLLELTYFIPFFVKIPTSIYIFDMALFLYPSFHPKIHTFIYKNLLKFFAKKAEYIFTISETSRKLISKYLKIPDKKIINVFAGIYINKKIFSFKTLKKYNDNNFLLTVSTIQPRKNLENLIKAFELFYDYSDFKKYKLIIVGKLGWKYKKILKAISLSKIKHRIILKGYVTEEELYNLYYNADLFIYISLYEGFGLPILESLYFKTPVLCSNIEVFKELFSGFVTFVNPLDIREISSKMIEVIKNKKKYKITSTMVNTLIKKYNWHKVSTNIWNVLTNND